MMRTYPINFDLGTTALIDLETRKVLTPAGFKMDNGESLRSRWQIFAAGIARGNSITLLWGDDEEELLREIGILLAGMTSVGYFATREFDEMICRGRFTNARRAHLKTPAFPAVPGAEDLNWVNLRKLGGTMNVRPGEQIPSKDVPAAWANGRREEVLDHLTWDVEELIRILKLSVANLL